MRISKTRSAKVVKAAGALGAGITNSNHIDVGTGDDLALMVNVTTITGAGATLAPSVQWSHNAIDWFTADPADTMTSITAISKVTKLFTIKGQYVRVSSNITGTTPSVDFTITAVVGD